MFVAAVLGGLLAIGGAGLSSGTAASVGGAADAVVGQTLQAKKANGKNTARKGQYDEAWRHMGLKSLRRVVEPALQCARHSYGQVQEFFVRTPCRSLDRALLALGDEQGNTVAVSIAWVQMPSAADATRLRQLIDVHGTGDVSPLGGELLRLGGVRFTGQHYDSRRTRSLVVIAEAEPASGHPDPELLDAAAEVAAQFPPL